MQELQNQDSAPFRRRGLVVEVSLSTVDRVIKHYGKLSEAALCRRRRSGRPRSNGRRRGAAELRAGARAAAAAVRRSSASLVGDALR